MLFAPFFQVLFRSEFHANCCPDACRSPQRKISSQAGATTQAGRYRIGENNILKLIYIYFQQNQSKAKKRSISKALERVTPHRLKRQRTCALKREKRAVSGGKKNEPSDERTSKTEMEGK
jgi:hypothetical protein